MRPSRVGVVVVLLAGLAWWLVWQQRVAPYRDPAAALAAFRAAEGVDAEEQLIDPLLLCGEPAVPAVVEYLAEGGQLRPWAALFLGEVPTAEGLAVLPGLVEDPAEQAQTRAYALAALHRADPSAAVSLAARHRDAGGWLGQAARDLVAGHEPSAFRRSWWEALLRRKH